MALEKDLPLLTPIRGQLPSGEIGDIRALRFREPKFSDLIELGEPVTFAQSEGGLVYSTERDDVLRSYINRLLIDPRDPALLNQLDLADGLRLKELIHGFFAAARERISKNMPTGLSST